jgi:hypothetical protein
MLWCSDADKSCKGGQQRQTTPYSTQEISDKMVLIQTLKKFVFNVNNQQVNFNKLFLIAVLLFASKNRFIFFFTMLMPNTP